MTDRCLARVEISGDAGLVTTVTRFVSAKLRFFELEHTAPKPGDNAQSRRECVSRHLGIGQSPGDAVARDRHTFRLTARRDSVIRALGKVSGEFRDVTLRAWIWDDARLFASEAGFFGGVGIICDVDPRSERAREICAAVACGDWSLLPDEPLDPPRLYIWYENHRVPLRGDRLGQIPAEIAAHQVNKQEAA